MNIEPGDAFAIRINSHRHLWNGQICASPVQWNCGAPDNFRELQCEHGKERCFHLNVFASGAPRVIVPDPSVERLLGNNPAFLDDQILFFYGGKFDLRRGRSQTPELVLYGAYRVKSARIETNGVSQSVVIEPYADGWAIFPRNLVRKPPMAPAMEGVTYLHRISQMSVFRAFDEALEEAQTLTGSEAMSPSHMERLVTFHASLDAWLDVASDAFDAQPILSEPRASLSNLHRGTGNTLESALAGRLKEALASNSLRLAKAPEPAPLVALDAVPVAQTTAVLTVPPEQREMAMAPAEETVLVVEAEIETADTPAEAFAMARPVALALWKRTPLPESGQRPLIAAEYGTRTVHGLNIATITKSLVLLAGAPGVGKSWLATRLLDDPERARSVIVPVSSTWRGREDLLGYVNPVTGEFEASEFTRFLRRSEAAWQQGDGRPRVAVFEEFNLSQPEHWLSDLLVRLEYEPERFADRTIQLGGTKISGEPDHVLPQIYLPPTLILAGTLNNDHTVRALSPRVLDRATLIDIAATGRSALARVGITAVSPLVEEIVEALNMLLEPRGVAFSVRTARSLRGAVEHLGGEEVMPILDHVLVQEVLSQVRLVAGDPQDEQLVARLKEWSDRSECAELVICRERIEAWLQTLQLGRDVFQA